MKQLVTTIFLLFLTIHFSQAQITTYKGQALFIYNFTKHIKWQTSPTIFTIGVYGKSDIISELNATLKGKQIEGKAIQVIIIASVADVAQCQLVFLPGNKSRELSNILGATNAKDILIVTEHDLTEKGAAISFVTVEEKLRFRINEAALSKAGLQVSGGLLSLALR